MQNDSSSPIFVLASASPARRSLLKNAGFEPVVRVSNFDESQIQIAEPDRLAQALAQSKAESVAQEFGGQHALIVGCDSVMWVNSEICGKPETKERAIAMWEKMRGGQGKLYTGHCLIDTKYQRKITRCAVTTVHFVNATNAEISSYIDTGEGLYCAGGFTLEGLGGLLIEKLEGCHTNVLGLSLPLLRQMLRELGHAIAFTPDGKVKIS